MKKRKNQHKLALGFAVFSFLMILSVGGGIAVSAWQRVQHEAQIHTNAEISRLVDDLTQHRQGFEQALKASRAFFAGSDKVLRREFVEYLDVSGIRGTYPAVYSFSYVKRVQEEDVSAFLEEMRADRHFEIVPGTPADEYWPLVFVHPEDIFGGLVGKDQRVEESRRSNIEHTRDRGSMTVSAPIVLLPDQALGVILALPLYQDEIIPETIDTRREFFSGALTIGLRLESFFQNLYPADQFPEHLTLSVRDISNGDPVALFSAGKSQPATGLRALLYQKLVHTQSYQFADKEWEFVFQADPGFGLSNEAVFFPVWIFIQAITVAVVILGLLLYLMRRQSLKDMKKENELLREKYNFISTVSHQLRTPVTAVSWGLDLLKATSSKQKTIISDIRQKTDNLKGIIGSMLYFIEVTGLYRLKETQPVSLTALCKEEVKKLHVLSKSKKVSVVVRGADADSVSVDAPAIRRVVSVLVDNAITYSKFGGRVLVTVAIDGQTGTVSVKDEGIGIPMEDASKVFNKIFRASNASLGKNEGSGVNLYVAREVVEKHGGRLTFQSAENIGSTFSLLLLRDNK